MSTRVIDEESLEYTAALKELLAAFAHGDLSRLIQAFTSLGYDARQLRLGPSAQQLLTSFHSVVSQLRSDFDPDAVTMSSTNIPDSITKLESVLGDTAKATNAVFTLLERQEQTLKLGEAQLDELAHTSSSQPPSAQEIQSFIANQRALYKSFRTVAAELVTTQEYQDLCGQRVQKVIKLMRAVELSLSDLLQQCTITLPVPREHLPQEQEKVEQDSVDDILKGFGI